MPTTFPQALTRAHAVEDARFANWQREATRSRGVSVSGLTVGEFEPATDAELARQARADVRRAALYAASPEGRFQACVGAVRRAAAHARDEELHAAASVASACADRGLSGELDHAAKCLSVLDTLGADVREAQAVIAELRGLQMAAE